MPEPMRLRTPRSSPNSYLELVVLRLQLLPGLPQALVFLAALDPPSLQAAHLLAPRLPVRLCGGDFRLGLAVVLVIFHHGEQDIEPSAR